MFNKIKIKLDSILPKYIDKINRSFSLCGISPLLYESIRDFVLRSGKRLRPTLFILGYLCFDKKLPKGIYESALSLELLHDFMLVHDDIIDKSDLRRSKPSMHALLNSYLKSHPQVKFNGQDLAIVLGDVMYALALHSFLTVESPLPRKEKSLKRLIEAALYAGSGEFVELTFGLKPIDDISLKDIYTIYDLKTAYYSFACPLTMGALLAGAKEKEVEKLFQYGACMGRAFQIKDDILGMFESEKNIGKSSLTDLKEAKKTILIWYAYKNSDFKIKRKISRLMTKKDVVLSDLRQMRKIVVQSKALEYAKKQIQILSSKAQNILLKTKISTPYKSMLHHYCQDLVEL